MEAHALPSFIVLDPVGDLLEWLYQAPGEFDSAGEPGVSARGDPDLLDLGIGGKTAVTLRTPLTEADVRKLKSFDPESETGFLMEAIRRLVREVGPTVPVLGFAAAPWTLASYMVEGRTGEGFATAKSFMYAEPRAFRELLEAHAVDYMQFDTNRVGGITQARKIAALAEAHSVSMYRRP